jgi:ABC-type oligopeptide transport system ATPase subunit
MSKNKQDVLYEVVNLCTWFPVRRGFFSKITGHVKAVDDVSLQIYAGETLGLVGESGSGKTTLGRTLIGLEKPHGGTMHYKGHAVDGWNAAEWNRRRREIQIIFQDPFTALNPRLSVLEILTEGLKEHNMLEGDETEVAEQLLKDVGLDASYLYRYPFEFSGGQRQRISIARAISMKPDFIVCDEAVSALDVSVQAQVINLLMDLKDKYELTYLFISHDLSVVGHICDRIAVMNEGRIIELGETDAILEAPQQDYTKKLLNAVPVPGQSHRRI